MSILGIVIAVLVVGVVAWLIQLAPFIDARFKSIAMYLLLAVAVIWILRALGVWGYLESVRI